MASGHVNRIYRPNTWLHRPMLQNLKKALANSEPSTHGTKRTYRLRRAMSAFGGKAENICSHRAFPVLTQSRHRCTFAVSATVRHFTTDGLSQASYRATRDGRPHRLYFEAPGRAGRLCLAGGEQGKCHANGRALSWRGEERDSTAELLRHEIVDDVQAEPDTALRTSGGEERIENVTLNFFRNAAAVIRESDLDLFHAEATRLDQHLSARPTGEAVSDGVEDEVGQHLPVGAGEAVHDDIGGHLNCE